MGENNWLATLGTWLTKPFIVVLSPWKQKLLDDKIESIAVKHKLSEAIVRFRLKDYSQQSSKEIDDDRIHGLVSKVSVSMRSLIDKSPKEDPSGESFTQKIEREILIQATPKIEWIKLACLHIEGKVNPQSYITIDYTDDKGNQHAMSILSKIQQSFCFVDIFSYDDQMQVSLTDVANELLSEYCSRNKLPTFNYDVSNQPPSMAFPRKVGDKQVPHSWKPNAETVKPIS